MKVEIDWGGNRIAEIKPTPTGNVRKGFREVASGNLKWWEETESFRHKSPDASALGIDLRIAEGNNYEPIDLSGHYNANVTDIFRNRYLSPRSPYTTLQIPVQGMGNGVILRTPRI